MWTKREKIMLFYPFEEKRLAKWEMPVIVQPKLDGERCRTEWNFSVPTLISSEVNEFPFLQHIKDELIDLEYYRFGKELDGELYVHGWDFSEIHSVASTQRISPHPDETFLQYHIFDYVSDEMQVIRTDNVNTFPEGEYIRIVPSYVANNFDEIYAYLQQFISEGYEGIIVRNIYAPYIRRRSIFGMKWKPKKRDEYHIKGYSVMIDKNGKIKPRILGRIICTDDEDLPFLGEYPPKKEPPEEYFSVGSGFTDEQRKKYWEIRDDLLGHMLIVEYQHLTAKKGVPRFGVFAGMI